MMCSKPQRCLFADLICPSCSALLIARVERAPRLFVIVVVLWLLVWANYGWSSQEKTGLFRCLFIIYWFLSSLFCRCWCVHVNRCVCAHACQRRRPCFSQKAGGGQSSLCGCVCVCAHACWKWVSSSHLQSGGSGRVSFSFLCFYRSHAYLIHSVVVVVVAAVHGCVYFQGTVAQNKNVWWIQDIVVILNKINCDSVEEQHVMCKLPWRFSLRSEPAPNQAQFHQQKPAVIPLNTTHCYHI